jgi:hypothetical protein
MIEGAGIDGGRIVTFSYVNPAIESKTHNAVELIAAIAKHRERARRAEVGAEAS